MPGAPRGSRRRDATGFSWDPKTKTARCNVYLRGYADSRTNKRKRVTIHARTKDEALDRWLQLKKKWRAAPEGVLDAPTFREFIEDHFDDIVAGLKPSTARDYYYAVHGRLMDEFGTTKIDEITSGRVNLWIKALQRSKQKRRAERRLSPASINGYVNVLKTIIGKAVRWDILAESPFKKPIDHVKVDPPTLELSAEERRAFLAAFDDRAGFDAYLERAMPRGNVREIGGSKKDRFGGRRRIGAGIRAGSGAADEYFSRYRWLRPFFIALLELGLRRGDALALRWSEVDLDAGLVQLTTRKRGVFVALPISRRCREALLECRCRPIVSQLVFTTEEGKPLSEARVRRVFAIAKSIAGFPKDRRLRIHDLRHTYASFLASGGVPLGTIATLLAHADPRTTVRYARSEKRAAAERARPVLDADAG